MEKKINKIFFVSALLIILFFSCSEEENKIFKRVAYDITIEENGSIKKYEIECYKCLITQKQPGDKTIIMGRVSHTIICGYTNSPCFIATTTGNITAIQKYVYYNESGIRINKE